jgi:molecular chaperone GrpE (heat shock protein)
MKAYLKFNLDNEFDVRKYKAAFFAEDVFRVLDDYKIILRQIRKNGFPESIKTLDEAAEMISQHFYDLLSEYDLPSDL